MKEKDRSPIKKRWRVLDDEGDKGRSRPATWQKRGVIHSGSNNGDNSTKSEYIRRSLLGEQRGGRDLDEIMACRTGNTATLAPSSRSRDGLVLDSNTRNASRGEPRVSPTESEYKTLKISDFSAQISDEVIEDALFLEFKKFGDVGIKISRVNDERVAFVNFRKTDDAKAAKHSRSKLLLNDRPLKIEAVYLHRRRSRSPLSRDTYATVTVHRPLYGQRPLSPPGVGYRDYRLQLPLPPPPPLPSLSRELERDFSLFDMRTHPPFIPEDIVSPENDHRANRTLFLGNLDITVTENDLRRAFERFGVITEVDIKRPTRGQNSTYGFLKFENLDMAHRAKVSMSGTVVGCNPIKIGYGRPTPTTRLWVGGLGPGIPLSAVAREFDRFGTIRTIDYRKGEPWAYIQYESLDAAQAACVHMRGFPLGGPERRLRVDFADTEQRHLQPLPHYELLPEPLVPRGGVRGRSPPSLRLRDALLVPADWPALPRTGGVGGAVLEHERRPRRAWSLEREFRPRRAWSLERELQGHDPLQKRQAAKRSPDSGEAVRAHHSNVPECSPGSSGQTGDTEWANRMSPGRLRPSSSALECEGKRRSSGQQIEEPSSCGGPDLREQRRVWRGLLQLKNSCFPTDMHLLQGERRAAAGLHSLTQTQTPLLRISQRLRLDPPKLEEVSRRMAAAGPAGFAVLLAVPGGEETTGGSTERPLRNLVSYLKQKQAAGVISLPAGGSRDKGSASVLHVFPPCDFSQQFLDSTAKALVTSEDFLVMVIVRTAS